jgi:hypothetical protein
MTAQLTLDLDAPAHELAADPESSPIAGAQ